VCCSEKLRDLYHPPTPNDQIKKNEMGVGRSIWHVCGGGGKKRNALWCLLGKREERRPVGGLGVLRSTYNIEMELK